MTQTANQNDGTWEWHLHSILYLKEIE